QNKGLEFSLGWNAIRKTNFELSANANISFNRNRINSLGDMESFGAASGWASTEINNDFWIAEGGSVGRMLGYLSDGRYEVSDFERYDEASNRWVLKEGVADASPILGTIRPGSMKLKDIVGDDGK